MKRAPTSPLVTLSEAMALGRLDAHAQADLLQSGEVSPLELTDAAIVRIEAFNPVLNAVCVEDFSRARNRAAQCPTGGVLAGVPYLLKDSLDYPGLPSRCAAGVRASAPAVDTGFDYTRRLDEEGLIPIGKTNMPEFALLPSTEPLLYGPSRNPWDESRSPGGSSGGAAVAVAAGLTPLAHAADGGGSIRIPASCCGVVGLKPGRGRNLRARHHHLVEDLLVADSLLSRSVRDVAWATAAALPAGAEPLDLQPRQGLKIALVMTNLNGGTPHPEVAAVIEKTARLCVDLGHHVETAAAPCAGVPVGEAFQILWQQLGREIVDACRLDNAGPVEDLLEPWTTGLASASLAATPADIERIIATAVLASQRMEAFFRHFDLILSPVLQTSPVKLGELAPTRAFESLREAMFDYVSYTPLHNMTGHPAISLPLFEGDSGLPVGAMFAAARGGEGLLLSLAAQLETAHPWGARWPALVRG